MAQLRSIELKVIKGQEMYGWCVQKLKYNKQGTIDMFRGQNATRKVQLMYLEVKMQQVRYGWDI